jgi:hypothetical protein
MKKIFAFLIIFGLMAPFLSFAQTTAKQKILTGVVTSIYGNQITFKTTSAAIFSAETSQAVLTRKNGASMAFNEILTGDKVEVKGMVWSDNSINASSVRNMSLYAHSGTFTGKIASINTFENSFTIPNKEYGVQTIRTDAFTSYKKNSSSATFKDMEMGFSVTVKGVYDRSKTEILAKEVKATVRLINISFTGSLVAKTNTGLTVVNNNVPYGVDITKAKLQDKSGKALDIFLFNIGDSIKVEGKHISESLQIQASLAKDTSVKK